ncbi:hypothetical protein [Tepidiphilus baoligensis]|uniref:Uncharacterized protein n=1 Tax=Tepidiphilus baoligensis TaxID=2698687 RepID=A0ABX1QMC9_9PROT|nr:hypothetical protein [Tepidiphilus baoligensis]NMH16571.1 hypothetical protein [Tepidiphilus baoligensis]
MATIDFKNVPTDVPLAVENIDRLAARATELATAFHGCISKIQQQVAEARGRFSREVEEVVRETETAPRTITPWTRPAT